MKKHEVFVRFGRVWLAVGLWMLASSLLVFGVQYRSFWGGDSNPDWRLRVLITVGVVIGLNWLTSRIIRPMAGPLVAHTMLRRMIVAMLVLVTFRLINRDITAFRFLESTTLALALSVALVTVWWRWLPYRGATFTISSVVLFAAFYLVKQFGSTLVYDFSEPLDRSARALLIGGGWSMVCGALVAWSARANGAIPLQEWADNLAYQLRPVSRWWLAAATLGALAVSGWVVWSQGIQNCQWIDQLTERSGCYRSIAEGRYSLGSEALAISADGSTLLNIEFEEVTLYRVVDGTEITRWSLPEKSSYKSIALSAGGQVIAIHQDNFNDDVYTTTLGLYQQNGVLLHTLFVSEDIFIPLLGFSHDGKTLLVDDQVWRVADGAALGKLKPSERGQYHTHPNGFDDVAADGSLTARSDGSTIGIFRSATESTIGTRIQKITTKDDIVVFSPDATHLATADRFDATAVHIWRISDGVNVQTINLPESTNGRNGVDTMLWTPDGSTIIVAPRYQPQIDFYRVK